MYGMLSWVTYAACTLNTIPSGVDAGPDRMTETTVAASHHDRNHHDSWIYEQKIRSILAYEELSHGLVATFLSIPIYLIQDLLVSLRPIISIPEVSRS